MVDPIRVNEEHLNCMLKALEIDRERIGGKVKLDEKDRQTAAFLVPSAMDDSFYKGMLSVAFSIRWMLPMTLNAEHAMTVIEELMRIVLDRIIEERARRSVEAGAAHDN